MSTDFDDQRKRVRDEIELDRQAAGSAFEEFLTASTEQVKQAWAIGVRKYVEKTEPDKTQELGPDAVKSLKADLAEIDARARSIIQGELDKLRAWDAYRSDNPTGLDEHHGSDYVDFRGYHASLPYQSKPYLPGSIESALESAVAYADGILRKYGWGQSSDRTYRDRGGHARLVKLPEPSSAMVDAMRDFSAAADRMAKARKQLGEIDRAESEHKAQSIWEET